MSRIYGAPVNRKLSEADANAIREMVAGGATQRAAAKRFNVTHSTVCSIVNGRGRTADGTARVPAPHLPVLRLRLDPPLRRRRPNPGEAPMTHAEICDVLGVEHSAPAPDWLPYAVRMTKVEIAVNGRRTKVYGGAMRCGGCGFGVDIRPGPGTQHPEPEALTRCPKCGYAGPRPTPETPQ